MISSVSFSCAQRHEFINSFGMKMMALPAGEFLMGSPPEKSAAYLAEMIQQNVHAWYRQSPASESPWHGVSISRSFYLGDTEVTVEQFGKFIEATGYKTEPERDGKGGFGRGGDGKWEQKPEYRWNNPGFPQRPDHPVVNVSWNDAVAFCRWLSGKEGREYRLPTEAEWEYACRGGASTRYFWGEDESLKAAHVWHGGNSGGVFHPAGQLKPNAFGLHDMCGNAYEYCQDRFSGKPYPESPVVDPRGPVEGGERVVRGGSWGTHPMHCRSAFRGGAATDYYNQRDGFRVACASQ